MHTIIHDCNDQWIGRHYHALNSNGLLASPNEFALETLRILALVARGNMTPETAAHVAFQLELAGFSMSTSSLQALEELANALIENNAKKLIAHKILAPLNENCRRNLFHEAQNGDPHFIRNLMDGVEVEELEFNELHLDLDEMMGAW